MAAAAKALILSRFSDLSFNPSQSPTLFTRQNLLRPLLLPATTSTTKRPQRIFSPPPVILNCLVSGVDGGGVADDFVSTRKSDFDREFSVIANMLKRIEPLDTSIISKGVPSAAKDSMKRTISTMLGLLPSDQFSVTIGVSRQPLDRLLSSSIITGYTLWNAEYRVSLTRNFGLSLGSTEASVSSQESEVLENEFEEREIGDGWGGGVEDLGERKTPQNLGDLSPEALHYIQELKSELATIEQELNAQKLENTRMECTIEKSNDLLDYLRSLEPNMVSELSRPSSSEVEEIIHQLVQNVLQRFFEDDTASGFLEDSVVAETENYPDTDVELRDTVVTSRDYLAKLLYWCMLLGHHLRGLEYRLHLSCVVGLL